MTLLSRRRLLQAGTAMVPAVVFGAPSVRASSAPAVEVSGVVPAALAGFDRVLKTYITERDISCAQLAIAKNGKHRMVAWFPNTGGEWLIFDGDSKPFTLRSGKGYRAPGPTGASPSADAPPSAPAPAPVAQEDLRGILKEVLQELRNPDRQVRSRALDEVLHQRSRKESLYMEPPGGIQRRA